MLVMSCSAWLLEMKLIQCQQRLSALRRRGQRSGPPAQPWGCRFGRPSPSKLKKKIYPVVSTAESPGRQGIISPLSIPPKIHLSTVFNTKHSHYSPPLHSYLCSYLSSLFSTSPPNWAFLFYFFMEEDMGYLGNIVLASPRILGLHLFLQIAKLRV